MVLMNSNVCSTTGKVKLNKTNMSFKGDERGRREGEMVGIFKQNRINDPICDTIQLRWIDLQLF